jgi:hypothetical protein
MPLKIVLSGIDFASVFSGCDAFCALQLNATEGDLVSRTRETRGPLTTVPVGVSGPIVGAGPGWCWPSRLVATTEEDRLI